MGPVRRVVELGLIGDLPAPGLPTAKPSRARWLPKHRYGTVSNRAHEIPLPTTEMPVVWNESDPLIEAAKLPTHRRSGLPRGRSSTLMNTPRGNNAISASFPGSASARRLRTEPPCVFRDFLKCTDGSSCRSSGLPGRARQQAAVAVPAF